MKTLTLILFLLFTISVIAQDNKEFYIVYGQVTGVSQGIESEKKDTLPIANCSIIALIDSVIVQEVQASIDGNYKMLFPIKLVREKTIYLEVTHPNYLSAKGISIPYSHPYNGLKDNVDFILSRKLKRDDILEFFNFYFNANPNDVESSEGNNEKLFILTEEYPALVLHAFCEESNNVQEFLISQFESPVHDGIKLELIYTKINEVESDCLEKKRILNAIKIAGSKMGLEVK